MTRFCFGLGIAAVLAATALQAAEQVPVRRVISVVRADPKTGKLVRSVIVAPRAVPQRAVVQQVVAPMVVTAIPALPEVKPESDVPANISEAVERIAAQHSLPPTLIHSVIKVESNYNPLAVSPKGAQGLMQLVPATARRFGVANVFNPVDNIQGGARYLRYLLDLYDGNYPLALAAYNAGEAAVARFGGVPPYRETQNYVVQVRKQLEVARNAEAAKQREREKEKAVEPKAPAGPNHIQEIVEADGTVRYVSR